MNWFEKLLEHYGYKMLRIRKGRIPSDFINKFKGDLKHLRKIETKSHVFEEMRYNPGAHPETYRDFECLFAAHHLNLTKPERILDIASYRFFVIGLLAHSKVTTVDVRERKPISENETVITCDVKKLKIGNDQFDAVVSLCGLEHFGLGRYGDEVDFEADRSAFQEMVRVLKPGGKLIFTTTITQGHPSILFNTHRIYSLGMIRELCYGLKCEEERFFNHVQDGYCTYKELTREPKVWNLYCGCWTKPAV